MPELPIEVCERIIDHVPRRETGTLLACALTCRSWYPRSEVCLVSSVRILDRGQLNGLKDLITVKPFLANSVREVQITGVPEEDYMDSFLELNDELMMEMLFHPGPHLAAFPAVFARRLNKVEHLEISSVYWRDCAIHGSFFFALSEFTSITRVELNSIYFTTLQEFGRLLCALPNVSDLVCSMLTWSSTQFNPLIFQRKGPKMRVAFLAIYVGLEDYLSSTADILNWFVATKSYTCLAEVQLSVVQKIGASIGSLLEAAGASIERVSLQLYAGSAWDESRGTVDQYLNLSKNIHLKSLCLSISEFDDGDSGWLSTLLSQITSFEVEDILLDLQASVPSTYDMHSALDRLHCDLLDDILARPQFENLRNITFKSVVSGVAVWESALRSRLPKLDARGIVKTNLSEVPLQVHGT